LGSPAASWWPARSGTPSTTPTDPFCEDRPPADDTFAIDHFYAKLLRLPDSMQTDAGREAAERRAQFLRTYLDRLAEEIGPVSPS
jgi:Predicted HD superfamily hydrolase